MEQETKEAIEKNMDLMLKQTAVYLPFLRVAFPAAPSLPDLCFNLMVGNALSTFLSQFAFRMSSPSEKDFAEFGMVVERYREAVKGLF